MTDLTPNDLSHLSDEEFNALCPQGEHAPGAEPLGSYAQAVHDAAHEAWITRDDPSSIAIATLRAAAFEIDWELGDPKFLLENTAAELENHQ